MIHVKYPIYLFFAILFFSACGSDDPEDQMSDKDCQLVDVYLKVSESTRFGVMSVDYDSEGNVSVAGNQDYIFTYDSDGNVVTSVLEKDIGVPRVETTFTYDNGVITKATQVWGDDPLADPRYSYDLAYEGNYLDKVSVSGELGTATLDFDFDSNGNALTFVDWIFDDVTKFTYDDTKKGLFVTPLAHSKAIAYSIGTGREFWFWNNAVTTVEADGEMFTFSNMYNDEGLLMEALTGEESYDFSIDYECK